MRNSAQVGRDGRIWFPTANGVISDPQHVDRPSHPPIPSIRSMSADGKLLKADRTFSPGVLTLDIRYFGLNLSNPSGVVYRYRLDGADAGWQEVGTRSEAIYTHPRPGTYVFHVQASNAGETWSTSADSQAFTILPAFYQTWWFDTLCVAAGVLLLWLAMAARTRYVAAAVRMRAEDRASERVRIARELHDTLLQGVQGLLLCFHAAAEKVPDSHEAKGALEKALATAEQIILEARDRVNRLRSQSLLASDLEPALRAVAIGLSSHSKIDFSMESTGERKELKPDPTDEVFYIAREALTNAFRHSFATRIALKLDYGRKQFVMECRDDGRGFDGLQRQQAEANGHWGLQGMQERARKIGGNFSYDSTPGNGTCIRLTLPAGRAYGRSMTFRRIFGRLSAKN
ncbi:MAG: ATP-binding protein [Acidobacteriia bacterium]|nr:ATP-binding protein [Terriglobia bacterium]